VFEGRNAEEVNRDQFTSRMARQREPIKSPDGLTPKLQSIVIAIKFGLVAEQPLFAHPRERRFAHDAP